jgi:hypothetical protein
MACGKVNGKNKSPLDCSTDGSIEIKGVPDGYTLTVISSGCTVYLTSPGEYNIPALCKVRSRAHFTLGKVSMQYVTIWK